jgi:hypothetical protein
MPRRILVPTLAAIVAFCGACGETRSTSPEPAPAPPQQQPTKPVAVEGTVETVASSPDGRTLVEFTSEASLEAGTPYRVHTADRKRIKGIIQVTDVPGKGRAVARVIALTDPSDPPIPGDAVRELDTLADPGPGPVPAAADPAEEQRFVKLREQYQHLIALRRTVAEVRVAEVEAGVRTALAERGHGAEPAEAKTAGGEIALAAVASERDAAIANARAAVEERDRLRLDIERLVAAQDELKRRNEQLIAERGEAERATTAQLTSESQAREQLAGRLAELEEREGDRASAAAEAQETLLALRRTLAETEAARDTALVKLATTAESQDALLALRRTLAETEAARDAALGKLAAVAETEAKLAVAHDALASARIEAASTQERHAAAAELARLEAERALFDLSARVLRLQRGNAELVALQERLRATLGAVDATGDATAPERRP